MNDEEQTPVFGQSDRRFTPFFRNACIFNAYKRIEEHFACRLKSDLVLACVAGRLLRIPHKALAKVQEVHVHGIYVYTLYIRLSSATLVVADEEMIDVR